MKRLILSIFFIVSPALAAMPVSQLPVVCSEQYAIETDSVLNQASGFAGKDMLKEYQRYMRDLKNFEDFLFKMHTFESNISDITTWVLARLRTPATKYNACRDQRVIHPSISARQCDGTYAFYMQAVLKELALSHDASTVQRYKQYMIQLKHLEDLRFRIHRFETQTKLSNLSTLRTPLTNYLGCRDLITRTKARVNYPIQPSVIR